MARINLDVMDWQRRFYSQPCVYITVDRDGNFCSAYESKEAAQLEVDWDKRRKPYHRSRVGIQKVHIHSIELARERWTEPKPADRGGEVDAIRLRDV